MDTTMPCLACGKRLQRVFNPSADQPSDGVMCETAGNYGSTVFDSFNGERLLFLICDQCLETAGRKGNVRIFRHHRKILLCAGPVNRLVVGFEEVHEPTRPWFPDDEEEPGEEIIVSVEDMENAPDNWRLVITPKEARELVDYANRDTKD